MRLGALFPRFTVPMPFNVTGPTMRRSVLFPPEFSEIVPRLVMVPCRDVEVLSEFTKFVPAVRVTPFRALLIELIVPPLLELRVPPLIVEPCKMTTDDAPDALSVPPALV